MNDLGRLLREFDHHRLEAVTRRHFLRTCTTGLGSMWLATAAGAAGRLTFDRPAAAPLAPLPPQFPAKAKRVIYLHMAGAPSQLELFDHKPDLARLDGQDCPPSFLEGKRFAFISGVPKMLGPQFPFHQAGKNGTWISDRLPHLERSIDELCLVKSMRTDEFNHAPAQLLLHTGSPRLGSASLGSWVTYGLGTENQNLPGYIVLVSGGKTPDGARASGAPAFCRASTRACSAVRRATPCSSCRIPRASRATSGGACSTRSATSTGSSTRSTVIRRRSRASRNTSWRSACR